MDILAELNPAVVYTPSFRVKSMAQQRKLHSELFVGKTDKEYMESIVLPRTPLRRFQTPDNMGHMVAFLLSDEAENITGQTNYVDGGMYMG